MKERFSLRAPGWTSDKPSDLLRFSRKAPWGDLRKTIGFAHFFAEDTLGRPEEQNDDFRMSWLEGPLGGHQENYRISFSDRREHPRWTSGKQWISSGFRRGLSGGTFKKTTGFPEDFWAEGPLGWTSGKPLDSLRFRLWAPLGDTRTTPGVPEVFAEGSLGVTPRQAQESLKFSLVGPWRRRREKQLDFLNCSVKASWGEIMKTKRFPHVFAGGSLEGPEEPHRMLLCFR